MRKICLMLLTTTALLAVAVPASAGPNDITLRRFGTCQFSQFAPENCVNVDLRRSEFRNFARDFGLAIAPRHAATPETIGQAGFAFQIDHTASTINSNEEYWQLANENGNPNGTLSTTQLHMRKGLPFSLELGGMFTAIWGSEMAAVGTELKWALHEDLLWPVPDFAIRGFVNTLVGDPELDLTNAGFDILIGTPIGVGNVVNITPFAGYNMTVVISSSSVLDFTPTDPRPPFEDVRNEDQNGDGLPDDHSNRPEEVFPVETQIVSQGIVGLRVQATRVNVLFQGTFSGDVQSYTVSLGTDF